MIKHTADEHQDIRDAVRALCAEFPDEYHRKVDEKRGYPEEFVDALTKAAKSGIAVVRSTRLAEGLTLRNNEVNDDEKGFVASGELNPAKSRVLLQLALTKTRDPVAIQKMFYEY